MNPTPSTRLASSTRPAARTRPAASGRLASVSMSASAARRLALGAQGFGVPRPAGRIDRRHLDGLFGRVGLLQIDSVNVLARAHYLPGWSRLGGYSPATLDRYVYADRRAFEFWAHEASLVPVAWQPLLRWRAERARRGEGTWGRVARFAVERPDYVAAVLAEVADRGPVAASELSEPGKAASGSWWGWGDGKHALEYLFWSGQIAAAGRRRSFERLYDLPERVIPAEVLAVGTPSVDEAHRGLLRIAADRLGVATAGELADFFRLSAADTRPRLVELVEAGDLVPVAVEGWRAPAYVRPGVVVPRRIDACALVSPFDPIVWERSRTRRMFGMDVVLEVYTPAAKRRYGYYVLPFLLGDQLVARVDLKADRAAGVLRVAAAWLEPAAETRRDEVADALADELAAMAAWLGLDKVATADRGDLAGTLARAG